MNQNPSRKGPGVAVFELFGAIFIGAVVVIFVGWEDDFQAVEPGEGGKWRLTHLVRGTVASFSPAEVESITAERDSGDDADLSMRWIRVRLRDGRSWSVNTRSIDAEEVLKKLAGSRPASRRHASAHDSGVRPPLPMV
ncbi:MAG: hypothetical protein HYX73_09465 [Acidobacteria bacterium]|nr:hypothetical protein [Acidobacteriota bacterium]